jgi:hypothetical protein
MPLQATSGAASYDAFGGGVPVVPAYIEEVFSTQVYTGTGATNNIVNGIDLAGKGGLVWTKARTTTSAFTFAHALMDTLRGAGIQICSDRTDANTTQANSLTSFNSDGYTLGADTGQGRVNNSSYGTQTYVGWTFRKQAKFFDVVTYTGDDVDNRAIPHLLGSVPGCMILKATVSTTNLNSWAVYHRSLPTPPDSYLILNATSAYQTYSGFWGTTGPDANNFYIDSAFNESGKTYVVYLYAHNAGGFGLTGTDNVISCGSYTGSNSSNVTVNLGYEPQWVMIKRTDSSGSPAWWIGDTMRGLNMQGINRLEAWTSNAESAAYNGINPTSTGFVLPTGTVLNDSASSTYIYIAIRRGPMKVPTSGTDVFQPVKFISTASRQTVGSLPAVDMFFGKRMGSLTNWGMSPRLTALFLKPNLTDAQDSSVTGYGDSAQFDLQNGSSFITSGSGDEFVTYNLRRSPSYFDVVCYTGTGSSRSQAHNLGVAPELMIFKSRDASNWNVFYDFGASTFSSANLNSDGIANTNSYGSQLTSAPTATDINLGASFPNSVEPMIAYLFATCAGVSKVGTYTGTGTTLQINCGFTSGARFVLIRRTSASSSDWYVWDSARGITAGNDPYLLLNSTAREVTNTDYVDTYSAGFEISSTAPAAINASGGTFIFLAIA